MTGINKYPGYKLFLLFIFIFIFIIIPVHAQFEATPVEKSTAKVIFQGKVYFMHTVKKGHTLYSISKAYRVKDSDIKEANPGISLDVLSEGQALKIPAYGKDATIQSKPTSKQEEYFYHTVEPKQTVYYVHQKYNVPVDVIYLFNPSARQGLQPGQVLKIPKNYTGSIPPSVNTAQSIAGTQYKVKDRDTLYIIARENKVPVAAIISANKELRWGLKPGQTIIIPSQPFDILGLTAFHDDSIAISYELPKFSKEECDSIASVSGKLPVKMVLMLPFYTSDMYVVDTSEFSDIIDEGSVQPKQNSFRGRRSVEFYEGLLLAIDSLKQQGINIQLYSFDTEGDTNKVKSILIDVDKIGPSLIIGPFISDNVNIVSKYCQKNGIPFVAPLINEDSITRNNTYLYQINPSIQSEIASAIDYLAQYYKQNIILAYKHGSYEPDRIEMYKKLLFEKTAPLLGTDTLSFREIVLGDNYHNALKGLFHKDMKNIFILLSNNEADVSNILSQLFYNSRFFDIEVFGLSQWQKFPNLTIEYMHGLRVTLPSSFFIDYSTDRTKNFIYKCRNNFGYEPFKTTQKGSGLNYSYLGYDLGMYFIKAVQLYGNNITLCSGNFSSGPLLLSDYSFERKNPIGCIENTYVNIIQYTKDYHIKKVTPIP